MPIYEFYCENCHTLYSFFARRVDTETVPACPKSKQHALRRQMSRFAISSGRQEPSSFGPESDVQDAQMEQAMMQMASEMEHVNEDDPKAMARMMRKLMETSGMNMGEGMEEAVRRLEAGEDPDQVDEELGDAIDSAMEGMDGGDGDPVSDASLNAARNAKLRRMSQRMRGAPQVDPEVYDM
ncbi:MAG: zinc ribbon domain-containing protein [Aureliella sp.]